MCVGLLDGIYQTVWSVEFNTQSNPQSNEMSVYRTIRTLKNLLPRTGEPVSQCVKCWSEFEFNERIFSNCIQSLEVTWSRLSNRRATYIRYVLLYLFTIILDIITVRYSLSRRHTELEKMCLHLVDLQLDTDFDFVPSVHTKMWLIISTKWTNDLSASWNSFWKV